jgi:hypothetical protein
MLIKITGYQKRASIDSATARPPVVMVPPHGVANWKRVDGPHEVPGGQKVTVIARWKCFEPTLWRTLYSDGTVGFPVTAKGPFRLHRGPKEVFEFQLSDPVNPRLIGEIVTFEIEMLVVAEDVRRRVA